MTMMMNIRKGRIEKIDEFYLIDGIPIHDDSEEFAKVNLGKEVEYNITLEGWVHTETINEEQIYDQQQYEKALIKIKI